MNTNGKYLDAMDDLAKVKDMLELLAMTCRTMPTDEEKALATGIETAMNFLQLAKEGLKDCAVTFTAGETAR